MKIVLLLLFLDFAWIVEPFSIIADTRSQNSARLQQHRLFASSPPPSNDDQIVDSTDTETDQNGIIDTVEIDQKVVEKEKAGEDTEALSGLLGEMFQAKLEASQESKELESLSSQNSDVPILGNDGIYRITSQIQLENFKATHSDKLLFIKFSSPICSACRMLKQKFQTLHRNPKFTGAPVVFAEIVISNNKKIQDPFRDYITSQLDVRRIPSINFYAIGNDALVDQICCDEEGGCVWPKIQQQMLDLVGQHYTAPATTTAAAVAPVHDLSSATAAATTTAPTIKSGTTATTATTTVTETKKKTSKRKLIRELISSITWQR